jgi:hypothetical protein
MTNATCFTIILVVLVGLASPGSSLARTPGATGAEAPATTGDWQITTFHSQTVQGTYSSIALDEDGNPHISFLDETSYDVKYVRLDGDNWEERTVDALTFLAWSNTSLSLDGNGQPQIAYPYANPCRIGHAQWDGTQWRLVKLDAGGCSGYVTLSLDETGEPCISYYRWASDGARVWLACREAAGWQTASVVDTVHYSQLQELALYHSLVLQGDGTPHLSYYRQIYGDPAQLWYATRSDESWVRSVVDEGPGVGSYSSLALDGQNRPRISYYDHTNGDLNYAKWSGSQWYTETVDSSGDVGRYTSLALDGSGHPHISYYDATNRDLKYAYWNGGQWRVETVDSSGEVGEWTSLMLNAAGSAHISYYDHTNGDLKYATNSDGAEHAIYLPLILRQYP